MSSDAYAISAAAWSSLGFILGFLIATLLHRLHRKDCKGKEAQKEEEKE